MSPLADGERRIDAAYHPGHRTARAAPAARAFTRRHRPDTDARGPGPSRCPRDRRPAPDHDSRGGGIGSSAYVLEYGGSRSLLDCGIGGAGMYSALPERLDAVVLTHAHGDHMGGLPELLRRQSDLRVYCSKSTKLLATYQANAADEYIPGDRMLVRDPGETYRILDGAVDLTLHRVAHILGSCAVACGSPTTGWSSTWATSAAPACAPCVRPTRCRWRPRTPCCSRRRSAIAGRSAPATRRP